METSEFNVSEGAFWHTNMDLYYGYQLGEVVEVEHESNKYWLATIEYSFKHLILLKWVGNYGEFWIDTSVNNLTNTSSTNFNEFSPSKRIFPPGFHLQSQLKSQFTLERPMKILVKPSLYDPKKDPYAEIKTVNDLLAHEIDRTDDAFGVQSPVNSNESASLVLAKCKTKIAFGQEDVDELEAALQNLNEIDSCTFGARNESPESYPLVSSSPLVDELKSNPEIDAKVPMDKLAPDVNGDGDKRETVASLPETEVDLPRDQDSRNSDFEHEVCLKLCKKIQESAITKGRYIGIGDNDKKVYYLKPKQFFDFGGANHERVFVPGTLLEICHTVEIESGLQLCHWFAAVLKNVGGRLTLRWFLCDEPKFKQGRLELKSFRSQYIKEEQEDGDTETSDATPDKMDTPPRPCLLVKELTFCMHFCNPRVHSISHAKSNRRVYRLPSKIRSFIEDTKGPSEADIIEHSQHDLIFDYRRMNLDKDRPIIDHLLSTARWMMPQYTDLSFAPKDSDSRREILLSTPRTTKLIRGFVKRELEPGVFEIHSEPVSDSGEVIKFIYPYDSSFTVLPKSWANNNLDCLSINPSRNPTPSPPNDETQKIPTTLSSQNTGADQVDSARFDTASPPLNYYKPVQVGPFTLLCEIAKSHVGKSIITTDDKDSHPNHFDELEPTCWSQLIRSNELETPSFHCDINYSSRDEILTKFKIMDQLEVVHPSSDVTICLGRIRKVVYPLLWIQISTDSYTLLPFNSTEIYPHRWCDANDHPLVSLLPPRKRLNQSSQQPDKKKKKVKNCDDAELDKEIDNQKVVYAPEEFDLGSINDKQLDIDYVLNEKSMYKRIYFNHKCFTGPSLSKGKICSLPQYVGPGPLRLVMEEVMTKVISVAYVPPRILNDLSSKSFEDLLIARNLTNTAPMEFKAKYQKRVHRENVPVCLNPDDVGLYCECVCEHLKCCYNLFGPNLFDGDDCPGHCRVLTKSNKFMKRATYYREKARLGEFTNDNGNLKKTSNATTNKTSRARYAGRDSSESTCSSISRSEQLNSRASSAGDEGLANDLKENLGAVEEMEETKEEVSKSNEASQVPIETSLTPENTELESETNKILHSNEQEQNANGTFIRQPPIKWPNESEFSMLEVNDSNPENWTVNDVAEHLEWCRLGRFKPHMISEVSYL